MMITNVCGLPGPCDTNEDVNVVRMLYGFGLGTSAAAEIKMVLLIF